VRIFLWTVGVVAAVVGAALLWFSSWRQPLLDADAAAAAGEWSRALERYQAAEARFNDMPVAQRALPRVYRATLANQLAAQYRLGDLDTLLEKADGIPATASSHFWAGSALFARSKAEENAEARLGWLGRATDEFKAALELEPDNWDVIYNYELSKRLFDELRKKPKTPPKQLLELLRPQPKEGNKPVKRVG
jgi:tetratricopeptide (TPR) repeat protein